MIDWEQTYQWINSGKLISILLLEEVADAELYLWLIILCLTLLLILQTYAFTRPRPVPSKLLPRRPAVQILFKQDDDNNRNQSENENFFNDNLPDSFAPLLSSSAVEIVQTDVTADLLHAFEFNANATFKQGKHIIPLNKNASRPQLTLDLDQNKHRAQFSNHDLSDKKGIDIDHYNINIKSLVGSDGFTSEDDFLVTIPTISRSQPMLKSAVVTLNPPLPLSNVAPTLIHIPTLFQDNMVPLLTRRLAVRMLITLFSSFSSFLERILWAIESKCKIHLSNVHFTPIYKGHQKHVNTNDSTTNETQNELSGIDREPQWSLKLSFSGKIHLFEVIPIPFFFVTLPTFIIPSPHALLNKLLTKQPLASGTINHENINNEKILLSIIDSIETWNAEMKILLTPPAVGADLTLPGGLSIAVETMLGRDSDPSFNNNMRTNVNNVPPKPNNANTSHTESTGISSIVQSNSDNSLSTWTSYTDDQNSSQLRSRRYRNQSSSGAKSRSNFNSFTSKMYDANEMVPWLISVSAEGEILRDKITFNLEKASAVHHQAQNSTNNHDPEHSKISLAGDFVIYRADSSSSGHSNGNLKTSMSSSGVSTSPGKHFDAKDITLNPPPSPRKNHFNALSNKVTEVPSVSSILLFPQKYATTSSRKKRYSSQSLNNSLQTHLLQYDYAFEINENSKINAISLSIGASHPMLNGGTMITTVLESIYAHGYVGARENAILNPSEMRRKRNILKHLPAVDFTCGIQNIFIPEESCSYSDDGQNMCLPELNGGRMKIRLVGGFTDNDDDDEVDYRSDEHYSMSGFDGTSDLDYKRSLRVKEGIKMVADFGVSSFTLDNECPINEFPELDILEGTKQRSLFSGTFGGRMSAHLRPQAIEHTTIPLSKRSGIGPNFLNPLEAFEIDFSTTGITLKIKEASVTIGHRRVIFPSESTFTINTIESILDMAFEGKSHCDFCWDFQGSSPILQVTDMGTSPANVSHEYRQQVSLLIPALRQGRVNFHISSVGGVHFTKAATTREHKEGLYDWKFFNALVAPDEESASRLVDVLHDKPTMQKLVHVSKLINKDLGNIFDYVLTQVWRAKDIFNQEHIHEAAHVIPGNKMARLASLFLCGDLSKEKDIFPIIGRVIKGEGLDIVKVKDLLNENLSVYDKWAPEIDRAVRWLAVLLDPMPCPQPYVENHVLPLSEISRHASRFTKIPSAKVLYDTVDDKKHIPLDPYFSNLVSLVAPYMSLKQVEYVLQARSSNDWQQSDLRRLRYVYSVKKKVLEISESYGGLSFLPQSFLVSVFVAEATRTSLKARGRAKSLHCSSPSMRNIDPRIKNSNKSIFTALRRRHRFTSKKPTQQNEDIVLSPAGRVASQRDFSSQNQLNPPEFLEEDFYMDHGQALNSYDIGDSLLGPKDVAVLLQAGLASSSKESTVVQLNQRMLLDLMASQPNSFAIGVLCELGNPGGHGSPRGLASALMSLLELNQSSFKPAHRLDIHSLLSSWTGIKIPHREWYLAGGRWARQSYYDALYTVAKSILEDGEIYLALKGHVQRVRLHAESDPLPKAKELDCADQSSASVGMDFDISSSDDMTETKLAQAILNAKSKISSADEKGRQAVNDVFSNDLTLAESELCKKAIASYLQAFEACQNVLQLDKQAFQADWFKSFYRRNYDALMVKSVFDNVVDDIDRVREWLEALRNTKSRVFDNGRSQLNLSVNSDEEKSKDESINKALENEDLNNDNNTNDNSTRTKESFFLDIQNRKEQELIDEIIDVIFYDDEEREYIRNDPIVRLLISNPEGRYRFSIISAMGVITDGKKGQELAAALERLEKKRGVVTIRADTGTARSFEFNASKIEEAIESAVRIGKPFGLLGYSQGCANMLTAESLLLSGPPSRQRLLTNSNHGLVCRQLLFSAANSSIHGAASDAKGQRLIVMCEEAFKYQQGYFSRALISSVLEHLNGVMDSAGFHKFIGGAQSLLPEGSKAFWREAQHLAHVPTCVLRGVMEDHTTPECLEMISNLLTKQSGSALHDSQVHVYDAVGHPIYTINRNGNILKNSDMGGSIQSTHHWSPLDKEVEFLRTKRDIDYASFECAKDRHVFPWVDVNARFGFIKYETE